MSNIWQAVSDTQMFTADDMVRVNISFGCHPLSSITKDDIRDYFIQQQAIKSVLDVVESWTDWVTIYDPFSCHYAVTINPAPGASAGNIRNQVYTALNAADATHTIKAGTILVGIIEMQQSAGILASIGDAITPGPSTAVTFGALAVIAVVIFLIFSKTTDIVT